MDQECCPHCGTRLPLVQDAFCGECGEALDEAPPSPPSVAERILLRRYKEGAPPGWLGFRQTLYLAALTGGTFTAIFAGMWVAYVTGHVDTPGVVIISIIGLFSIPLFAGSVLIWTHQRRGLSLMKFGALLFLLALQLRMAVSIWHLEHDPECLEHLGERPR
jgi:hypothetical protein